MSLSDTTMAALRATFNARQHYPSDDHWVALQAVAETLEAMANTQAADKVYLSAIDCGVGKSSSTLAFARSLVNSAEHLNVGMLICVNRKREAEHMAGALADLGASVCVLTGDTKADISDEQLNRAQILITTQQRIEQAIERQFIECGQRSFADLDQFYYHCQPRQVRVHDEAFLPGDAINLSRDLLGSLLPMARVLSADFHTAVDDFMDTLKHAPHGSLVDVPNWTDHDGVNVDAVLQHLAEQGAPKGGFKGYQDGINADVMSTAKSMFLMAGRSARVHKDGNGEIVIEYRVTIPDDMRPLLVLDASGRVRQTYQDMKDRGYLKELPRAIKDYSPLTVHWWKRGGGKASFRAGGDELVSGTVKTIQNKPTEDWLVVVHKPSKTIKDIARQIQRQLPAMAGKVHYVTWGNHLATNDYADVPNVILCGTLFMAQSHYVALTHLCKDSPVQDGFCQAADVRLTAVGETADGVFQAISRGRVRKSDGPRCQPMHAYVIATAQSGMGTILPAAFPGSTILDWNPLNKVERSKARLALDCVTERIEQGAGWVSFKDLKSAIEVPDKNNFKTLVLRNRTWIDGLAALGLVIVSLGAGRESGVSRMFEPVEA